MYSKSSLVLLATVIALAWGLLALGCIAADTTATPASTPAPATTPEGPAASAAAVPLALAMGGPYTDYGKDIARDAAGNLYVTGYFRGTVDFDPGPGVVTRTAAGDPLNVGATDLFLARYTPDGALTWVMSWGGTLGADMPHTVRVDGHGDLLLTGYFSGQPDFDPSPTATFTLNAGVGRDLFVAKYTAAGNCLWALGLGDAEATPANLESAEEGMDVTFDAANNVYLTGVFSGTIDLDPADGNDSGDTFTSAASRDLIVASYSPTGTYRWGFALGGPGQDHGHALRVGADGSVYLGGMFSNAVDFDPGAGVTTLTAAGGWDAFLAKYSAAGAFGWAYRLGGTGYDQVRPGALELAGTGDVLIGGSFANTVDFDPGPGTANLTSAGDGDLFVARYAADGTYRWAIRAGAAGLDFVHRVAVDAADNVYVTGAFLESVDFDPGAGTATLTAAGAGGASDAFVAKYTAQGAYLWANQIGGAVSGAELLGIGTGLAVDAAGNVAATGRLYGVADLGSGVTLTSAGDADIFVVRYDPQGALVPVAPPAEGALVVDFNDGTAGPLMLSYGPTDAPPGDPAYTVVISNGAAHYLAPPHAPGMRFTGMLDLPESMTPITGDLTYEWTFPMVSELRAMGTPTQTGFALAGCYIRGEMYDWVGGLLGDYWFGYAWSAGTGPLSVIRQGTSNLTSEPFTPTDSVTYRLVKAQGTALGLYANYDQTGWHQVGVTVTLVVTPGGSDAVAVTHVRAVDPSGKAVSVTADDFIWRGPGVYPPPAGMTTAEGLTDETGHITLDNITVTVPLTEPARAITLTLGLANAWRDATHWNAAWLFVKYRTQTDGIWGPWQPATLVTESVAGGPLSATVTLAPEGRGAFVYRAAPGQGPVTWPGVPLRWQAAADGVAPTATVALKVFALSMIYIPEGVFSLGDGSAATPGHFHAGGDSGAPYQVTATPPTLANTPGGLWALTQPYTLPGGTLGPAPWDSPTGTLAAAYPTGYAPFYLMEYEMTQGLYAAFLNTLTPAQATARYPTAADFAGGALCSGNCRYTITVTDEIYTATVPSRANNWLNWEDGIAFTDWAGLRPLTELEFEKAGRGPLPPVAGEYAWGSTAITTVTGFTGDDGSGLETPLPFSANTVYSRSIQGPVRAGLFRAQPTREQRGVGYYGNADLSGNVVEMVVSLGSPAGRAFTAEHGDGLLGADGRADNVASWPRIPPGATGAYSSTYGFGYRGGDFWNPEVDLRLAARNVATFGGTRRLFGLGYRAGRTAPTVTPPWGLIYLPLVIR